MKKHLFVVFLLLIIIMLPMIMILMNGGRTSYLERKVSFDFSLTPSCLYEYDRFSQGKDYDKLTIFEIDSNIVEFENYLHKTGWHLLPLSDDVLNHPLCDASFDTNMINMLSSSNGYWHWDEKFDELIVYDADEHRLYIRNASVLN